MTPNRRFRSRSARENLLASDLPVRWSQANSFAGTICVGTLRRECLDHLLIHDERHLRQILAEYAPHYDGHRPHQSRARRPPLHEPVSRSM
jgi:putative transposase